MRARAKTDLHSQHSRPLLSLHFPFLPREQPQCSGIPAQSSMPTYIRYSESLSIVLATQRAFSCATAHQQTASRVHLELNALLSRLISNLMRLLRVSATTEIAASHTVSRSFLSTVVCGCILSRGPFLEHGKLVSKTFD